MKWNTQRKAVVAVLALAGAALCVDRFVLGYSGPRAAAAVETTADVIASAPAATSVAPSSALSLAKRVAALAADAPGPEFPATTDALCIPASWNSLLSEPEQSHPATPGSPSSAISGVPTFAVSSVFHGADSSSAAARIDGKLIRVGQSIRGHELLRIEKGSPAIVVLAGPGGEVRIPFTIGGDNSNPGPDEPAAKPAADGKS